MKWYYARNNERLGPIDQRAFDALVADGTITADTLVWREGMANWMPYSSLAAGGAVVAASASVCAECGRSFPPDALISLDGNPTCSECKPVVLQRLREGVGAEGAVLNADLFYGELKSRGYRIEIGSCLSRGWNLVKANFWPSVGVTALVILISLALSQVPCLGPIAQIVLTGPLFGGLYWYFIRQVRGETATVNDAFEGFRKPFGQLALASLVSGLATIVLLMPVIIYAISTVRDTSAISPPVQLYFWIGLSLLAMLYLTLGWLLAYPLIVDKRLPFWDAMRLSWKIVHLRLGAWLLFFIVVGLLNIAGFIALCIGALVTMPVGVAAWMYAYEDIFSRPPAPAVLDPLR